MYLRPFLFGHGGAIGLGPAPMYNFSVVAVPVGAYYKGGLEAIDARVVEGYDRAAPRGVGNIKAAGNYAPDVQPSQKAKKDGFPVCLYLDAKTNSYVEEFSTSNFIGVTKSGVIVTPTSVRTARWLHSMSRVVCRLLCCVWMVALAMLATRLLCC